MQHRSTPGQPTAEADVLRGTVQPGRQEAAGFLSIPWVADGLFRATGFVPYPGTLNLRLGTPAGVAGWARLRASGRGLVLAAADPGFCAATCFAVRVNGRVAGAIVLPHVAGYPDDVVEVVAAERLRDTLGLRDGDPCELHPGDLP